MPIDHGKAASSIDEQRERVLAMQTELAALEQDAANHPDIEDKRKALQAAYSTLGMTGFEE